MPVLLMGGTFDNSEASIVHRNIKPHTYKPSPHKAVRILSLSQMATKPLTVSLCSEPHTGDVQASFGFLKWSDLYLKEKPFQVYIDIPKDAPDQRRHNLNFEEDIEYTVHSVRGRETQYTLDENGFAYVKHKSSMTAQDFQDEHTVVQRYYEELEELLKRHMDGVDQVCIFDWRVGFFAHRVSI